MSARSFLLRGSRSKLMAKPALVKLLAIIFSLVKELINTTTYITECTYFCARYTRNKKDIKLVVDYTGNNVVDKTMVK